MTWQKVVIPVPEDMTPSERKEAGQAFVDQMVENASNGIGVTDKGDGFARKKFPKYSAAYAKEKGSSNVDLTLSGEMLSALKVISTKKGAVVIGFDKGSEANAKAEGNITGSYGKDPNPKKARNFLGLIPKEIREIVLQIKGDE